MSSLINRAYYPFLLHGLLLIVDLNYLDVFHVNILERDDSSGMIMRNRVSRLAVSSRLGFPCNNVHTDLEAASNESNIFNL